MLPPSAVTIPWIVKFAAAIIIEPPDPPPTCADGAFDPLEEITARFVRMTLLVLFNIIIPPPNDPGPPPDPIAGFTVSN